MVRKLLVAEGDESISPDDFLLRKHRVCIKPGPILKLHSFVANYRFTEG